jgi:hypothetical protein
VARDSRPADVQFPRDRRIGHPTSDEPSDLELARGQGAVILFLAAHRQHIFGLPSSVPGLGRFGCRRPEH